MSYRIHILTFVFLFLFPYAHYSHAQSITVAIPTDLTTAPGASSVKVPVTVTDLTNLGVISVDLTVSYDTNILTATSVTMENTIAGGGIAIHNIDDTNGIIDIAIIRATPLNGSGVLIFILFDVEAKKLKSSSPLALIEVKLNSGQFFAATSDGQITVDKNITVAALSVAGPLLTVSIPTNITVALGKTSVQVPVNVSNAKGLGLISANLAVSYDADMLTATGATLKGTIAESGIVVANPDNSRGTIRIGLIFSTPQQPALVGSGVLVYINFDVKSITPDDSSPLSIMQASLNSNAFTTLRKDGKITANTAPTFYGDVSGDKKVTVYDARLIFRYLVGLETLNAEQIKAGDVSKNGKLTALDATLIFQYIAGLIREFPASSR